MVASLSKRTYATSSVGVLCTLLASSLGRLQSALTFHSQVLLCVHAAESAAALVDKDPSHATDQLAGIAQAPSSCIPGLSLLAGQQHT